MYGVLHQKCQSLCLMSHKKIKKKKKTKKEILEALSSPVKF